MTRDGFWELIETTRSGEDPDEHAAALEDVLTQQTPSDIVDFERQMADLLASAYCWELWGAAYLINGGCSDDGFEYFRGWLLLQGRSAFEAALSDPDSLADLPELEECVECEDVLYVARAAYRARTGNDMVQEVTRLRNLGEGWDFDNDDEMKKRYPKLFAKFCDD